MARILISMNDAFLNSIDEVAQNEHRTRSELIREALRAYIKKQKTTSPKKAENNAKILENLLD
ncbi:MAG: ribbon-helix-helix protein, CopG family [Candidatus Gastranaerophilales bacterium]|nr:ribbon-helix-helix protein, CopG family [Candidatus Gastranaerophilales bacterium]